MYGLHYWFFCVLLIPNLFGLKPEHYFDLCSKSDPEFNQCVIDTLHKLRSTLKIGIRELKIPSLEPMQVPKIKVVQGSGPVSLDSTFTDLLIHGITDFQLKSMIVDVNERTIQFDATLPMLFNEGPYVIDGRVLVLPISGSGNSWANYTDVSIKGLLKASPLVKKQKTYWNVDSFKFDLGVKKALIHFENLFNGNQELGDAMNRFMSENWEVVFKELKPVVDEAVSALLTDIARKVFIKFPENDLFLP